MVPKGSLLVLSGNSGSGKSTLASRLFEPHQVVSADFFRGLLCGDEGNQNVTGQAWKLANQLIQERLLLGQTTVVDSVALQPRDRASLVAMASKASTSAAFLMLWASTEDCLAGQLSRERQVPREAVLRMAERATHTRDLLLSGGLAAEGFRASALIDRADAAALTLA